RDHALALGEHQPPERHHPLAAHGLANDREGLVSDRLTGRHVIGGVEEAPVDLPARHKAVDLDGVGAFDLDRIQLGIIHDEVLALGDLIAAAFIFGGDRFAGLLIDELLAQAIAGRLADLPECDALGGRARRMQRNRTGDQGKFEVAFPVRTHNQLLSLRVYAYEAGYKDRDALFNSVAG